MSTYWMRQSELNWDIDYVGDVGEGSWEPLSASNKLKKDMNTQNKTLETKKKELVNVNNTKVKTNDTTNH